jgi:hypothetical protein
MTKRVARFRIPKQLRADVATVNAIARCAVQDCRGIGWEILFLIKLGLRERISLWTPPVELGPSVRFIDVCPEEKTA